MCVCVCFCVFVYSILCSVYVNSTLSTIYPDYDTLVSIIPSYPDFLPRYSCPRTPSLLKFKPQPLPTPNMDTLAIDTLVNPGY